MHRDGKFDCEKCNIKFTFEALQSHNKRHHQQHRVRQSALCPICKLKLAKPLYLGNSILTCNERPIIRNFSNLINSITEQHMKVHTAGNVTCDICHIRFTPASLIYHRKTFHPHIDYRVPHSVKNMRRVRNNSQFHQSLYFTLPQFQKQKRDRERQQKTSQFLRYKCKLCKVSCQNAKRLGKNFKFFFPFLQHFLSLWCLQRFMKMFMLMRTPSAVFVKFHSIKVRCYITRNVSIQRSSKRIAF